MNDLPIAAAQFEHHSADKEYNLSVIDILSDRAGKMGAKVVTWTLGDLDAGVSPTLDLFVQTGLNPKAKQEFTSLGDHSLNDGPTASFTYNGNQYTLKGPAVIVTVVAAP